MMDNCGAGDARAGRLGLERARRVALALARVSLFLLAAAPAAMGQRPTLVSVKGDGTNGGNQDSSKPRISANGRFVVFESNASDLVPNVSNNLTNVYLRDLFTGVTTLVSVNQTGVGGGNDNSTNPSISDDGRYIVYQSRASDLVPNDLNGSVDDVFVRDRVTAKTELVSINAAGTGSGNVHSVNPVFSSSGRFVAFESNANDLVANDINGNVDVFVRDRLAGTTELVSINSSGTASGSGFSQSPSISDDGQFVAFQSDATNLAAPKFASQQDVFVRDILANTTELVSVNSAGTTEIGALNPVISPDGRYIAFESASGAAVGNDSNNIFDLFVRDRVANTTELVTADTANASGGNQATQRSEPAFSSDGRLIVFRSEAGNLVANDINGSQTDVFVRDLTTDTTTLVSVNSAGTGSGNQDSGEINFDRTLAVSADGQFVAFVSSASDLVANDTNGNENDIFLRDTVAGTTRLMSVNSAGTGSGAGGSLQPAISASGRIVTFVSSAEDLAAEDANSSSDVFAVSLNGTLEFSAASYSRFENGTSATITVRRSGTLGAVSVQLITSNGTAAAGIDYTPASGTLDFAAGQAIQTFSVPITNDTLDELAETVKLRLSAPSGGAIIGVRGTAVLTIADEDPKPGISITDVALTEGNAGSTDAVFTVSLSAASGLTVAVNFATANGTAASPADFTAKTGSLTFAPGQTSKTVTVAVKGDLLDESNESFNVNLSAPTNATVSDGQGACTVTDNDPTPSLSITDASRAEGDAGTAGAVFTVKLSAASGQVVTVQFATANGTAVAAGDYTAASGTLTFEAGQTSKTVTVLVRGDNLAERDETFNVKLSAPTKAAIADGQGVGTIVNDD